MPVIVYQDGRMIPEDEVRFPPFSPALRCGFSLYETVRTHGEEGRTFRLSAHVARLARSASHFGLDGAPDPERVRDVARRLAQENGIQSGRLRITLASTTLLLTLVPYVPPGEGEATRGWKARIVPFPRDRRAPTTGHKCGHFLDVHLFRRVLPSGEEGILLNDAGRLCEGCYTNLFLVRSGVVHTPSLEEGCLPGITRGAVLGLAGPSGIEIREGFLTGEDREGAEEAFLTNALMGVVPLTRWEDGVIGEGIPGPITRRLGGAYLELVREEGV
ncbi:MAG: aminotransferase class IV [Planctomycetota bacterium]|jgi:branched-subunit amino acid aminotransferase/4-amino-4-deoxychorismate lyase